MKLIVNKHVESPLRLSVQDRRETLDESLSTAGILIFNFPLIIGVRTLNACLIFSHSCILSFMRVTAEE